MSNREKYTNWCQAQSNLPIFFQPWWLDQVVQSGTWDVAISHSGDGRVQGVLPYYTTVKKGLKVLGMPLLTPYLGIWSSYEPGPNAYKNSRRYRKLVKDLLDQLPQAAYCYFFNHPRTNYLLPARWQGFKETTRYTYLLDAPIDLENQLTLLKPDVRNKIRKAEKMVTVEASENISQLYDLVEMSFRYRKSSVPFSREFLTSLNQTNLNHSSAKLLVARDDHHVHAAIYLVMDNTTVYNLLLGADPAYHSSGAVQLLLWNGIQFAETKGLAFDFEGSMIPDVNKMFSGFGGTLIPYSELHKSKNMLIRMAAERKRQNI